MILVSGTMEQAVQHTDGKTETINVRGSFDSATNTLIVQADNRNLDFEKIGLHEEFHAKFKNNRSIGEWFYLGKDEVESFNDVCSDFEKSVKLMKDNPFF